MKAPAVIGIGIVAAGVILASAGWWIYRVSFTPMGEPEAVVLPAQSRGESRYGVTYLGATATPTVLTDALDHHGVPVGVSCSTCHSTRTPDRTTRSAQDLETFHHGLKVQHGNLSCLSCHNADNYDTLRLADGTQLEYTTENVTQLCAQCHGPKYRDYLKGSHGGMSGYWDLSRGPRARNACTVCHDAHSPAYPQQMPVFPPPKSGESAFIEHIKSQGLN